MGIHNQVGMRQKFRRFVEKKRCFRSRRSSFDSVRSYVGFRSGLSHIVARAHG